MLAEFPAMPVLAVSDLDRARAYYEGTLGFTKVHDGPEGVVYGLPSGGFLVYQSDFAGTTKATAMSFMIGESAFAGVVADLHAHGVHFLTFDTPMGSWDGDVLDEGTMRSAWFTDPDGNILNIGTMSVLAPA